MLFRSEVGLTTAIGADEEVEGSQFDAWVVGAEGEDVLWGQMLDQWVGYLGHRFDGSSIIVHLSTSLAELKLRAD